MEEDGAEVGLILAERIRPCDKLVQMIGDALKSGAQVLFVEEGMKNGGCAMICRSSLCEMGCEGLDRFGIIAIDDDFVSPASPCDIYDHAGISVGCIINYFKDKNSI